MTHFYADIKDAARDLCAQLTDETHRKVDAKHVQGLPRRFG
jgi:hypothetical protein